MKDNEIYYIEIICIIFLIVFVFLLFFNMSKNTVQEIEKPVKPKPVSLPPKIDHSDVKVRCPPKLVNLYEQDIPPMPNKNDLDVINKNTFNMYSSNKDIDNANFNKEIITQDTIKTPEQRVFTPELEKIYTDDLAENTDPNFDYNQIYNYSLKPNKGDLPIANVPLCALKDNHKSFKLSDRMIMA
jgi:hypothetical protein